MYWRMNWLPYYTLDLVSLLTLLLPHGLFNVPQIQQASSCHRESALAAPSPWNALPILVSYFKTASLCHHTLGFPGPLSLFFNTALITI